MKAEMDGLDSKLKDVVGMANLKLRLKEYMRDAMADRLRRDLGVHQSLKRPVMLFIGNPGTGKTSIAVLVAGNYTHIQYVNIIDKYIVLIVFFEGITK
jgi:ATP-dependent Lon protease